ncbi:MAG: hypothetical protein JWQ86_4404 [Mycobacterium sp.]|nr:hypothetical protein [Mycobacterium sp.]
MPRGEWPDRTAMLVRQAQPSFDAIDAPMVSYRSNGNDK